MKAFFLFLSISILSFAETKSSTVSAQKFIGDLKYDESSGCKKSVYDQANLTAVLTAFTTGSVDSDTGKPVRDVALSVAGIDEGFGLNMFTLSGNDKLRPDSKYENGKYTPDYSNARVKLDAAHDGAKFEGQITADAITGYLLFRGIAGGYSCGMRLNLKAAP